MRVLGRAEWNRPLGGGSGGIEGSERQRESSKVAVEGGRTSCGETIVGRHRGGRKQREMLVLGRAEWNRPLSGEQVREGLKARRGRGSRPKLQWKADGSLVEGKGGYCRVWMVQVSGKLLV